MQLTSPELLTHQYNELCRIDQYRPQSNPIKFTAQWEFCEWIWNKVLHIKSRPITGLCSEYNKFAANRRLAGNALAHYFGSADYTSSNPFNHTYSAYNDEYYNNARYSNIYRLQFIVDHLAPTHPHHRNVRFIQDDYGDLVFVQISDNQIIQYI